MKLCFPTSIVMVLLIHSLPCLHAGQATEDDVLIADFEGETYGDWVIAGEAFGPGPARGTLAGQMHVDGFFGTALVNSFFHGDGSVGTLTSPEFRIERRFISFLIGGGMDAEKTCVNLIIDGKTVRNATGPNDAAGGSEALLMTSWDISHFVGQMAQMQIVDQATGGWGHACVQRPYES